MQNFASSFFEANSASAKKRKKARKNGLVEKLDLALKRLASDRALCHHLPSRLRCDETDNKRWAQVLKVFSKFSKLTLECLDYQLDPESGARRVFDLIVDSYLDLKTKKISQGCDITIEGPWLSFTRLEGSRQVISNVSKLTVMNESDGRQPIEMIIEQQVLHEF